MPAGLAGTDRMKSALSAPELPVAPDTGGSTDDDLDALADQLNGSPPPRQSRTSKQQQELPADDDTNEPQFPSIDDEGDEPEDSLDDAVETDDDDGDDDAQREALAEAYGIDVSQLAGFSTAKDAENALALMDQRFAADAGLEDDYQEPVPRRGQQQPQQFTPAELEQLALELDEWEATEPSHKNFTAVQKSHNAVLQEVGFLRQALGQIYHQQLERERQSRVSEFNSTLDRMKSPLFGAGSKLTPLQQRNRAKLSQDINAFAAGRQQLGQPLPAMAQLVDRVTAFSFRNQLAKQQQRTQQQPTNGRSPRPKLGNPGRGKSRKDNGRAEDWDGDFEDNPALHKLYQQFQETSGG
jgi:hypothetical protein